MSEELRHELNMLYIDITSEYYESARERLAALLDGQAHEPSQVEALRILLAAKGCLAPDGTPEIREEISAQFDIPLSDVDKVLAAIG